MGCIPQHSPDWPHGKLTAAAAAYFKPPPEIADGFEPEDYWEESIEVWPENWDVLNLFVRLQTQWSWAVGMGGGGRLGLRYEAVYPLLDRMANGDQDEWNVLFADIQAMERAVLAVAK